MSKYWNELTKNIDPYVAGEQPKDKKYIKLNTNENPYGPSSKVIAAIKAAASEDLRLYPDPDCTKLRSTIAKYYKLSEEQVFIGNGSDEVLALAFMTFFSSNREIVYPDISYSFYPVYSSLFGLKVRLSNVREDFSINVEDFLKKNGGIIIPNPNAPTGRALKLEEIRNILKHNKDSVVIIDEAYVDFGAESAVSMIEEYKNLLVIQTLSKSRCLAGMRVGFALGSEELIEGLNRIKNSFNSYTVDRVAQVAAVAAFQDEDYFRACTDKIIKTRQEVVNKLENLNFTVVPSKSNFIFATHKEVKAKDIFEKLKVKGVLVRYFNKPKIDNYLRISIGSEEEMKIFIEKIKEVTSLCLQRE